MGDSMWVDERGPMLSCRRVSCHVRRWEEGGVCSSLSRDMKAMSKMKKTHRLMIEGFLCGAKECLLSNAKDSSFRHRSVL